MRRLAILALVSASLALVGRGAPVASAEDAATAPLSADVAAKTTAAVEKGRAALLAKRDAATGSFGGQAPAGFTALATSAWIASLSREQVGTDAGILKSLEFVASKQRDNGAIASIDQFLNYETSTAISAFAMARIQKFASVQTKARDFLVASQVGGDEKGASFGGYSYGPGAEAQTPSDLSNAQTAAGAAHDAGVTDEAYWKRFLVFLGRVQNRSETNKWTARVKVGDAEKDAVSGNDGGGVYSPGKSKAAYADRPDGKVEPRSYGSMTYALLKCLLFAGVKSDDPRVVAAVAWLSNHFTVDRNPGFENDKNPKAGQQGYYYYLLTMSRALAEYEKATGKPLVVTDEAGKPHRWRDEVAAKLVSLQHDDGSWSNDVDRWEEASPVVVTSYAVMTLATCQGRLP